jgi:hypothetical protein
MAFDIQASWGSGDKAASALASPSASAPASEEGTGGGCQCPYCGRTISSEELQAQGYAPTELTSDESACEPDADVLSGDKGIASTADNDDAGIISRFNASRPRPLQADAGRAAGLLSAARRMVKNKDY